jgi:hypothetical protein
MRISPLICGCVLVVAAETVVAGLAQNLPAAVPQIPRDSWKDCLYNDAVIRCRDVQTADQLQIFWIDGLRSRFQRRSSAPAGTPSTWGDPYGGRWRRELMPKGNTLLTNLATGHRILIPLRFPCKPPLKGEVGYCHE